MIVQSCKLRDGMLRQCSPLVLPQAVIVAPIMLLNPGFNVYDIRKRCEGPLCYKEARMV